MDNGQNITEHAQCHAYCADVPGDELPPLTRMGGRTIGSSEGTKVSASESLSIGRVEPVEGGREREREREMKTIIIKDSVK